MQDRDVAGYEHIEKAADLLKDVIDDLFLLSTKAQERATEQPPFYASEDRRDGTERPDAGL